MRKPGLPHFPVLSIATLTDATGRRETQTLKKPFFLHACCLQHQQPIRLDAG